MLTTLIISKLKTKNIFYTFAKMGVFLGLSFVLTANFIVAGFYNEVDKKLRNILGDIIISTEYFSDSKHININSTKPALESISDIKNYDFLSYTPTIVSIGHRNIAGIIGTTNSHTHYHVVLRNNNNNQEIIHAAISKAFAKENNIKKGDTLTLSYLSGGIVKKTIKVVDIYENLFLEVDDKLILVSQEAYKEIELTPKMKMCKVFTKHNKHVRKIINTLMHKLPLYNIASIRNEYNDIYAWLDILKKSITDLVMIILIISLLNIFIIGIIFMLEHLHIFKMMMILGSRKIFLKSLLIQVIYKLFIKVFFFANSFSLLFFFALKFFHIPLKKDIYYIDYVPIDFNFINFIVNNIIYLSLILVTTYVVGTLVFSTKIISNKIR